MTARPPDTDRATKKWLESNGIEYDQYFNMKEGQKHNIDQDIDILIDDYLGNIVSFLEKSDGKAILFSQPWNRNRESLAEFQRQGRVAVADGWEDVMMKVDSFLAQKRK